MIPGIPAREYYQTALTIARTNRGPRRRAALRIARYWLRLLHAQRQLTAA